MSSSGELVGRRFKQEEDDNMDDVPASIKEELVQLRQEKDGSCVPQLNSQNAKLFFRKGFFRCTNCSVQKSTLRQLWGHQALDAHHGEFAEASKDFKKVGDKFLCNVDSTSCGLQRREAMEMAKLFIHQMDERHGAYYHIARKIWYGSSEELGDHRFESEAIAPKTTTSSISPHRQDPPQERPNISVGATANSTVCSFSQPPKRLVDDEDEPKARLTQREICSPLPRSVFFVCNATDPDSHARCTRRFKALGDLIHHQLDLNTQHGQFYEALVPMRDEDSDTHGKDWTHTCPVEGCPKSYKAFSWSQLWKHSLDFKHGSLWFVALEYWRQTGENRHWFTDDGSVRENTPEQAPITQFGEWVLNPIPPEEPPPQPAPPIPPPQGLEPAFRGHRGQDSSEREREFDPAQRVRPRNTPAPLPSARSAGTGAQRVVGGALARTTPGFRVPWGSASPASSTPASTLGNTSALGPQQRSRPPIRVLDLSGPECDNSDGEQSPIDRDRGPQIHRRRPGVRGILPGPPIQPQRRAENIQPPPPPPEVAPGGQYVLEVFLIPAFRCYICRELYHIRAAFIAHFDKVHPNRRAPSFDNATANRNTFQCLVCPSRINNFRHMQEHVCNKHLRGRNLTLDRIRMREGAHPLPDRVLRMLANANRNAFYVADDLDDSDEEPVVLGPAERRGLRQGPREARRVTEEHARMHQDKRPRLSRN